ncbi:hypothetical protein X801_07879, partial [Opisthorchis viverrini]
YLIPISIVITIELQQLMIAYLISSDVKMYEESEDLCAKANSAQVADELGQVEFLFSDKTGTMTKNSMRMCLCGLLDSKKVYTFRTWTSDVSTGSAKTGPSEAGWNELSHYEADSQDGELNLYGQASSGINNKDRLIPDANDPFLKEALTISALCHTADIGHEQVTDKSKNSVGGNFSHLIPNY